MPTKVQAKNAIDNESAAFKADIDNILPVGVNIVDGQMNFAPGKHMVKLDAGGSAATAISWANTIQSNLTAAVPTRPSQIRRRDRRVDPENTAPDTNKQVVVVEQSLVVIITNF